MWRVLAALPKFHSARFLTVCPNSCKNFANRRFYVSKSPLLSLPLPVLTVCIGGVRVSEPKKTEGKTVKLIIAAIKPFKLEEVREALTSIGVRGMMVTEIKGFGSQSGHTEIYRGAEYAVNFVPKVKLEIVVADSMADQVVETIQSTARTDKIGDGKIFVLDVSAAVRVRTGETNDDAL